MSLTIYALFYLDASDRKNYFYVGRSNDVSRRERQHRYAKIKGHEDKYEFIRSLDNKGLAWQLESLREIPDDESPPDNERWFVIKLTREGHTLTNMRHGSAEHRRELAEQVKSPLIRNATDVRMDQIRRKYSASRNLRRRVLEKALRNEGIPNVAEDGLLPPILRKRLLARNCTCVERGVSLSALISSERAEPLLRSLRQPLN